MTFKLLEAFGPEYPRELGKDVANFRKLASHGLGELPRMARRGYGNAVLSAIRAKQASALKTAAVPGRTVHCASGTNHTTGHDILKAVRAQHRAASVAQGPFDQNEANRKYAEAMEEKHGAVEYRQAA